MTRVGGRIVRPGAMIPGYVEIDGPTILAVVADEFTAGDDVIVPGFVDLHCHGGGGHTFTTGDADAARAAAAFHLRHGTTTMLASLVSSPFELMRDAVDRLPAAGRGRCARGRALRGAVPVGGPLRRSEPRLPPRPVGRRAERTDRARAPERYAW